MDQQTYNLFPKFLTMQQRKQIKVVKPIKQLPSPELKIIGIPKPLCEYYYDDDFIDNDSYSYIDRIEKTYYNTNNQMNILDWPDMD